jgi:hypothetical protein
MQRRRCIVLQIPPCLEPFYKTILAPEPTVLKALWRDINWFLNKFVGILKRSCSHCLLLIAFGKSQFKPPSLFISTELLLAPRLPRSTSPLSPSRPPSPSPPMSHGSRSVTTQQRIPTNFLNFPQDLTIYLAIPTEIVSRNELFAAFLQFWSKLWCCCDVILFIFSSTAGFTENLLRSCM